MPRDDGPTARIIAAVLDAALPERHEQEQRQQDGTGADQHSAFADRIGDEARRQAQQFDQAQAICIRPMRRP